MDFLRKILFPFAVLYGFIMSFRNFLYDKGILKSVAFDVPIIAVGNLNVGGTGKTPQIEYLVQLLSPTYRVATLSRGYKRKSKGFLLADNSSTAEMLGDEPFQFFQKFPHIQVAVDENRVHGIEQLLSQQPKPEIILLDDAFQHRKVQAGFYILLTAYNDLYCDDLILPAGNLREGRDGADRANLVIVTKCPPHLTVTQENEIKTKLKLIAHHQPLFFTYIEYDSYIYSEDRKIGVQEAKNVNNLVVAGIAKPTAFFAYLQAAKKNTMVFSDHHNFTPHDIETIKTKAKGNLIITTEKDFVRLKGKLPKEQLFYLPIKSTFVNYKDDFDKRIMNYVGASTGNR
nr:tetraacyldisaccharide 4'-kinase [uncultured Flavobacterium sp.]